MSDLNPLPAAMRPKERYLKFRIHAEEKVELGEVVDAIWESALDYMGEKGCSEADFWIVGNRFDMEEQEGIVRVRKEREDDLRAALSLVESFNGEKGFIETLDVSGSINKLG